MTPKQQIFADEYLKDTNGTRAYKVAYPQVKKIRSQRQPLEGADRHDRPARRLMVSDRR